MSRGYVTNGTSQDGFGARLFREITAMAFTFYLQESNGADIEYIHTPYTYEGFENFGQPEMIAVRAKFENHEPYNEVSREGYLERSILWENKLKYSGITINDINLNEFEIIKDGEPNFYERLFADISARQTDNKLYYHRMGVRSEFDSGRFGISIMDTYYPKIKERYLFINPEVNNDIMIHIRRKDAIWGEHRYVRYLEDEYYLEILNALTPFKNEYNITIHTQRKNFDFAKYDGWNIVYDDEEQDYDLLVKMVSAKILITGKSSLSICAGLLNQNTVVYPHQYCITKGLDRFLTKEQFIQALNNNNLK